MAATITTNGLNRIGINGSQATGYSSSRYIRTMAVDDGATGFGATDDSLDDAGGAPSNEYDQALDGTPSISSQKVTHVMTIGTANGNFTIKRISLHDDTAANVTTTSTTLIGGIDAQSITKTSDFTMAITVSIQYADAS